MENKEYQVIEKMLYDAQTNLPTTNIEWRVLEMKEETSKKKSVSILQRFAASVAIVLVLGIGGITVFANMEIDIDPGEYGFDAYSTTYVVKHGTTYLEALTKHVYNPISLQFDDNDWENKDGHVINIHVGTLDEEYWHGYFEYVKIDGKWVASKAETSFEYEGFTIYGYEFEVETRKSMHWQWIDEKNGVGWSVSVPINSGLANELDDIEVVKQIIDLNR